VALFGIRPLFADKQTYPTAASLLLACVERAAGFAFGGGMTFVLLRANDRHPSYLPALRRWGRSAAVMAFGQGADAAAPG
jgi:hypothetical protein